MSTQVTYTAVDYVVAAVILVIPSGIGIWYAVKDVHKATRSEYLLGGRRMSIFPVALSTFITFVSAVSLMGTAAEVIFFGGINYISYVGMALSYVIGYFTLVPLMSPLKLTSVYEYLKLRYKSEAIHLFCTVVGIVQTVFYQGIVLLLPALALQACADLPLWVSIALFGSIGTLYTTIGGFKSVIWTDAFQTVVVFIGVFTKIVMACVEVGGIQEVWRLSREGGRLNFDKFSIDPRTRHTMWSLIIGNFVMWSANCYGQAVVQRISSLRSVQDAKKSFLINVPLTLLYGAINCFVGLCMYAYYTKKRCGPFEAGLISNKNQIAPYFVLHEMADIPGMAGLYLGVLCCGALSSLSSGINAMAANTVQDLLRRPLRGVREATVTLITKLLVMAYGVLAIGLAFLMAESLQGPATQMASAVFGALGSPIMGIIVMGASVPWANKYGAFAGALTSLCLNIWMSLGSVIQAAPLKRLSPIPSDHCFAMNSTDFQLEITLENLPCHGNNTSNCEILLSNVTVDYSHNKTSDATDTFFLYDITYEWYPVIGCIVCITTGLIVSFFTNTRARETVGAVSTETKYIYPVLRRFWGCEDQTDTHVGENTHGNEIDKKPGMGKEILEMENHHPLLKDSRLL